MVCLILLFGLSFNLYPRDNLSKTSVQDKQEQIKMLQAVYTFLYNLHQELLKTGVSKNSPDSIAYNKTLSVIEKFYIDLTGKPIDPQSPAVANNAYIKAIYKSEDSLCL
ncbi:hypothetical protein NLC28_02735 [Candidatus Aminicenantes bacterium AC-335-O07]|nr:hypothetical protein [Candidatus Aminicenantes bacterium AC-335-O07]